MGRKGGLESSLLMTFIFSQQLSLMMGAGAMNVGDERRKCAVAMQVQRMN